jgi:hypothetical protein
MSEETKTQASGTARKEAPVITVSSPSKRSSMDEIYRDNPGEEFAYASMNASEASLAEQGLKPVERDGQRIQVRNRVICQVVSDKGAKETARQFKNATEMANATRDPKKSSKDKSAKARKPVKKEES